LDNKKPIIFFSSFRAQLYLIVGLFVVVFVLILLMIFAGRFVEKIEKNHAEIMGKESQVLLLVARESPALNQQERFAALLKKYSDVRSSCLQCHEEKTDLLSPRVSTLRQLNSVIDEATVLQDNVQKRLQALFESARYIHEHHIAIIKNFSRPNQYQDEAMAVGRSFRKSDARSASELEIIQQIVIIQQSIYEIRANFHSLNREVDLGQVQKVFTSNLATFYAAVNMFEDYSLDAQDGLLVEELLDSGRIFQRSLHKFVELMEQQIVLLDELEENRKDLIYQIDSMKQKLLFNRDRLNNKMGIVRTIMLVIVVLLVLISYFKSRWIIDSISEIVRETEKIEIDFHYRIEDDPLINTEFKVLVQALNSMAGEIEQRVGKLNEEIDQRVMAEKKLSLEKERLAVTLESIGDGVITSDKNGRVVFLNKVAEKLTGWSLEEARGKPVEHVMHIVDQRTGEPCPSPVNEVLKKGGIIELADKVSLITKDGSIISIADSGAPIQGSGNQIIGVVLVFRDVTERQRMEDELMKMKKLESLGVMAGGIAHDFNNILMAILGNIQLASRYIDKENKAAELLVESGKAANKAKGLTQQLLTFSRGGYPVKKAASVERLIKDSSCFILRGSHVGCKYHFGDDLWLVDMDQGQISQVIQNVTLNAAHAMHEGGLIAISCENISDIKQEAGLEANQEEYVKITITDKGQGIALEDLDRIFDPYFTTKTEGEGLGLAVSYSIVKKHNGFIQVDSEINKGTTVTIYLPAVPGVTLEANPEQDISDDCKGTIMVMDDNVMVLQITTAILRHLGYDVICVKDGREAIDRYKEMNEAQTPIDVIIMDLTIPGGMGGEEAVKEILKIDRGARVIVASGYSEEKILADYKEYGFQGALSKPFELQEISRILEKVLKAEV